MNGYFDWRDKNVGDGQNGLALWLQGRAKSNRPNSPDMSWFNEGNGAAVTARPQAGRTLGTLLPTTTTAPTTTGATTTTYPPGGFWNSWTQWPNSTP